MNNMAGGWFSGANTIAGCGAASNPWRQLAAFTASTGGTVNVIADNYSHRGVNWQYDSDTGPAYMFASAMGALV
jgi:hypothetical protein